MRNGASASSLPHCLLAVGGSPTGMAPVRPRCRDLDVRSPLLTGLRCYRQCRDAAMRQRPPEGRGVSEIRLRRVRRRSHGCRRHRAVRRGGRAVSASVAEPSPTFQADRRSRRPWSAGLAVTSAGTGSRMAARIPCSTFARQLAPTAGTIVGNDVREHGGERNRVAGLTLPDGHRAGSLVVVAGAVVIPWGSGDQGAVLQEDVDVVLGSLQGTDIALQDEVRTVGPLDCFRDLWVSVVGQIADFAAEALLPMGQGIDVGINAWVGYESHRRPTKRWSRKGDRSGREASRKHPGRARMQGLATRHENQDGVQALVNHLWPCGITRTRAAFNRRSTDLSAINAVTGSRASTTRKARGIYPTLHRL